MKDTIDNKEAIEMMRRCKQEIISLRTEIARLRPKADAYDNMAAILRLLPQPSMAMGEDFTRILDIRIHELTTQPAEKD